MIHLFIYFPLHIPCHPHPSCSSLQAMCIAWTLLSIFCNSQCVGPAQHHTHLLSTTSCVWLPSASTSWLPTITPFVANSQGRKEEQLRKEIHLHGEGMFELLGMAELCSFSNGEGHKKFACRMCLLYMSVTTISTTDTALPTKPSRLSSNSFGFDEDHSH